MLSKGVYTENSTFMEDAKTGLFYCGGFNVYGVLGLNDQKNRRKLVKARNQDIKKICFCDSLGKAFFLTKSGKLLESGNEYNYYPVMKLSEVYNQRYFQDEKIKSIYVSPQYITYFAEVESDLEQKIYFWGYNNEGKAGGNEQEYFGRPTIFDLSFLDNDFAYSFNTNKYEKERVIDIKGGFDFSIVLSSSGNVYSSGSSRYGQCGIGKNQTTRKFKRINFDNNSKKIKIITISTGVFHTIFLSTSLHAYSTGRNTYGQLGLNSQKDVGFPTRINLQSIIKIDSGEFTTFFVSKNSDIYCCGRNDTYQLGLGHSKSVFAPTLIIQNHKFIDVHAGKSSTIFVTSLGTLYSCGENKNCNCIVGYSNDYVKTPTKIKGDVVVTLEKFNQNTTLFCRSVLPFLKRVQDVLVKTKE